MMRKRMFALLLTAALILPAFVGGNTVRATKNEDTRARLESTIQTQFRTQAKKLDRSGADETVQKQFLRNARTAEDLYAKPGDPLTAVVFNSNLYEYAFVKSVAAAIDQMQKFQETEKYIRGGVNWYDYRLSYTYRDYTHNRGDTDVNTYVGGLVASAPTGGVATATDNYDAVLMLLGGSTYNGIEIERTKVTATEMIYEITSVVYDDFNFDGNYDAATKKGYDTSRAKILTILGRLLGYKEFHWETTAKFQVTVPYYCDHESGAYHWTYADKVMTNHVEGEFSANAAEKIVELKADGTEYSPYFEMDRVLQLRHDKPWVVEFTNKSSGNVALCPTKKISSGYPFILRTNTTRTAFDGTKSYERYATIGEYLTKRLTPQEQILLQTTSKSGTFRYYYGFDYTELYTSKQVQTFRFENRVAADGSNMVWLYIDGVEQGPMTDCYMTNKVVTTEKQEGTHTRLNGQDIYINYIGNQSYRQGTGLKSVTVWENGEGVGTQSSFRTAVTQPTCTQKGYTTFTCDDCGYSYKGDYTAALGHTLGEGEIHWAQDSFAANASSDCTVCKEQISVPCTVTTQTAENGEIVVKAETVVNGQSYVDSKTVSATREGEKITVTLPYAPEGSAVMAAVYEDGQMTGSHFVPVADKTVELTLAGQNVRLFFLSGSCAPLIPDISF